MLLLALLGRNVGVLLVVFFYKDNSRVRVWVCDVGDGNFKTDLYICYNVSISWPLGEIESFENN